MHWSRWSNPARQPSSYPAIQPSSHPFIEQSNHPAIQLTSYPAIQLSSYPAIQRLPEMSPRCLPEISRRCLPDVFQMPLRSPVEPPRTTKICLGSRAGEISLLSACFLVECLVPCRVLVALLGACFLFVCLFPYWVLVSLLSACLLDCQTFAYHTFMFSELDYVFFGFGELLHICWVLCLHFSSDWITNHNYEHILLTQEPQSL